MSMPLWVRTLLVTGPPEEVEAAGERHRNHLRDLRDRGKLKVAGELGDAEGFLEVYEAADRKEAEEIARSSPLVHEGLGAWMLRAWTDAEL
jgi:uncharacterized protein YciI